MQLYEIELERHCQEVMDAYSASYEKVYHVKPVIRKNGTDRTIVRDIIRDLGYPLAKDLATFFPGIDDDWFRKKGHSLQCLKDNVAVVNAQMGSRRGRTGSNQDIRILTRMYCNECHQPVNNVECWALQVVNAMNDFVCDPCKVQKRYSP